MSYFSDIEYKKKEGESALWFERLYFSRWFTSQMSRILDIGCATGNIIALDPDRIDGVDSDEASVRIAKQRGFRVEHLDVERDFGRIPDASYDGIYAKHVIEHLHEPLAFLQHIRRVLAPGGKAVISTPNCPYMLARAFWDDYTHVHPFTKKSLAMLAYDAGFPPSSVRIYQDFRCFPGLGFLMRTFGVLPETVRFWQTVFGIQGLSLIMEVTKE